MKRIYLTGTIGTDTYERISQALFDAHTEGVTDVDLILNSEGGSAYDAMAIYDLLEGYRDVMSINTYATGLVASAATLILAGGTNRYMTKNAWVMVHEDSTSASKHDKVSDIEAIAKHSRTVETQWNELLAKHTKLTADEWTQVNKTDTYLTPAECLAYGLIDEVI